MSGSRGIARTGLPKLLWRGLMSRFLGRLAGGLAFFAAMLGLVDLFSVLWRFLTLEVPFLSIFGWLGLGIPGYFAQALPVAVLFAASYTLAELHASGELTVVFGSGISVVSFTAPVLAFSLLLSGLYFVMDDAILVPATRERNNISRTLLKQSSGRSTGDVALIAAAGRLVYRAAYFDDAAGTLNDVTVVGRDAGGKPDLRVSAPSAAWKDDRWQFKDARAFVRLADGSWTEEKAALWDRDIIAEPPDSFRNLKGDLKVMSRTELKKFAAFLQSAGLPYAEAESERLRRFAFALTPFIVGILAASTAGRFRKNALLLSLVMSLSAGTVYYVGQMIGMLMAKTEVISPLAGACAPAALFFVLAVGLMATAKT